MGTITEKLQYTLEAVNDIKTALQEKNENFNLINSEINNEKIEEIIKTNLINFENITAEEIEKETELYSYKKIKTLEELESKVIISFANLSTWGEVWSSNLDSYNLTEEAKNYITYKLKTEYPEYYAASTMTEVRGSLNEEQSFSLYSNNESNFTFPFDSYNYNISFDKKDGQTSSIDFLNKNIILDKNNKFNFDTEVSIDKYSLSDISKISSISFSEKERYSEMSSNIYFYTNNLIVDKISIQYKCTEPYFRYNLIITNEELKPYNDNKDIIYLNNYSMTPFYNSPKFVLKTKIIETKKYFIDGLKSCSKYIKDIGNESTIDSNSILKGRKGYDPKTGGYIIGELNDYNVIDNEFIDIIYNKDNKENEILLKPGFYGGNYKSKNSLVLNGEDINLKHNYYEDLTFKLKDTISGNNFARLQNGDTKIFRFYYPNIYKNYNNNDYYSTNTYSLMFGYINKNIYVAPILPGQENDFQIVNNVPNTEYHVLGTTASIEYAAYIRSIVRIDPSTFLIGYDYETGSDMTKMQGLRIMLLHFEEKEGDDKTTLTWTKSSSLQIGQSLNTGLSGSNYGKNSFYFFPFRKDTNASLEFGIARTYDYYGVDTVHRQKAIYWNEVYRTTTSGALTLNSTSWSQLCSVAPSTTSGYHWAKLFPSKYGGITFCSQTNNSNYTEKFIERMGGRVVKANTIELNPAGSAIHNNLKGIVPLGVLKDGNILFLGERYPININSEEQYPIVTTHKEKYNVFYIKRYNPVQKVFVVLDKFTLDPYNDINSDKYYQNINYENVGEEISADYELLDNNLLLHKSTSTIYQIFASGEEDKIYDVKIIKKSETPPTNIGITDNNSLLKYTGFLSNPLSGLGNEIEYENKIYQGKRATFCMAATNGQIVIVSPEKGLDNYEVFQTSEDSDLSFAIYGNGRFLLGSSSFYYVMREKGVFEYVTPSITMGNLFAYGNSRFVNANEFNANSYFSNDGFTWTALSGLTNNYYYSLTYGKDRFIIVGEKGKSFYLADRSNKWVAMTGLSSALTYTSVIYNKKGYFTMAYTGELYYSADGTKWTLLSINGNFDISDKEQLYIFNGNDENAIFLLGIDNNNIHYFSRFIVGSDISSSNSINFDGWRSQIAYENIVSPVKQCRGFESIYRMYNRIGENDDDKYVTMSIDHPNSSIGLSKMVIEKINGVRCINDIAYGIL